RYPKLDALAKHRANRERSRTNPILSTNSPHQDRQLLMPLTVNLAWLRGSEPSHTNIAGDRPLAAILYI
ncbi:MAG: hypothetical protein AAFX40_16050, partial [Cyanobacteria bacterium J06639_1]